MKFLLGQRNCKKIKRKKNKKEDKLGKKKEKIFSNTDMVSLFFGHQVLSQIHNIEKNN